MNSDKGDLLATLESHGVEFLKLFGDVANKGERTQVNIRSPYDVEHAVEEDVDEWTGFTAASDPEEDINFKMLQTTESEIPLVSHTPQVVVFREGTSKRPAARSLPRNFMSSRISNLKETATQTSNQKFNDKEENDHDISNLQNDALLHRLVHTKLLSGSLNPDLDMTPAQKRKALAGRVLELSGDSKLGKGEAMVRQDEKARAAKHVREGMIAKQRQRNIKSLNEAQDVGNYHPALKRLFAASSSETQQRKRVRGLKLGVGKFSGGMLKLTRAEIGSVRGIQSSRGGRRGKKR